MTNANSKKVLRGDCDFGHAVCCCICCFPRFEKSPLESIETDRKQVHLHSQFLQHETFFFLQNFMPELYAPFNSRAYISVEDPVACLARLLLKHAVQF